MVRYRMQTDGANGWSGNACKQTVQIMSVLPVVFCLTYPNLTGTVLYVLPAGPIRANCGYNSLYSNHKCACAFDVRVRFCYAILLL